MKTHPLHTVLPTCSACRLKAVRARVDRLTPAQICAIEEDTLRNYCITESYRRLSRWMAQTLDTPGDANWATFASWASCAAGTFIRGEALPLASVDPLGYASRVSALIAQGNLIVYKEIAPAYHQLIGWLADDGAAAERAALNAQGPRAVAAEIARRFGLDPRGAAEHPDGKRQLIAALTAYFEASFLTCPDARAEHIFLANGLIGIHEQTRLQEVIAASLTLPDARELSAALKAQLAPLRDGRFAGASALVMTASRGARRVARRLGQARPVRRLVDASRRLDADTVAAELGTRALMTFDLPGERMRLGEDVPALPCGRMFPTHLASFESDSEWFQAHLAEVLSYDKTPHTLVGSGARNWGLLTDRMNFILDLFRSRQQHPPLFQDPLAGQLDAVAHACARRVPAPALAA